MLEVRICRSHSFWGKSLHTSYTISVRTGTFIEENNDERKPWVTDDITEKQAVRGIHSVSMLIRSPDKTLQLMTEILGFEVVNESESRHRLAVNGDVAGKIIEIVHAPDADSGVNGIGTVHHVAMAISHADEQLRIRDELIGFGCQVTEVRDRQYFRSIYFREPGGVLFEIATA